MNARHTSAPVIDPDDIGYNNTSNPALESLIPARLSRRGMLRMDFGTAGSALLGSAALAGCGGGGDGGGSGSGSTATPGGIDTIDSPLPTLGFNAVAKSLADVVVVPAAQASTGAWAYTRDSRFNRRVHTLTPMILSGPAAGNAALVTQYSTDGRRTRGTVNNCANGTAPWGTYLTCEENWGVISAASPPPTIRSAPSRNAPPSPATCTNSSRPATGTWPTPTAAWPPATSTWTTAASTWRASTPTAAVPGWS